MYFKNIKRTCICCKSKRRLPCIGIHRKNGKKTFFDWKSRNFHVKCFNYLKKQNKIYLNLNKSKYKKKHNLLKYVMRYLIKIKINIIFIFLNNQII